MAEGVARTERVVLTPALYLPGRIKPISDQLRGLSEALEEINVLRPIVSYRQLRRLRQRYRQLEPSYRELLADCLARLSKPVEGAATIDIAWYQGFTFASGMAGILELTQAHSSVSEGLDRKSAYALACLSLYIAVASLVPAVVGLTLGL